MPIQDTSGTNPVVRVGSPQRDPPPSPPKPESASLMFFPAMGVTAVRRDTTASLLRVIRDGKDMQRALVPLVEGQDMMRDEAVSVELATYLMMPEWWYLGSGDSDDQRKSIVGRPSAVLVPSAKRVISAPFLPNDPASTDNGLEAGPVGQAFNWKPVLGAPMFADRAAGFVGFQPADYGAPPRAAELWPETWAAARRPPPQEGVPDTRAERRRTEGGGKKSIGAFSLELNVIPAAAAGRKDRTAWSVLIEFGEVSIFLRSDRATATVTMAGKPREVLFRSTEASKRRDHLGETVYLLSFIPVWNGLLLSDGPPGTSDWGDSVIYLPKDPRRTVELEIDDTVFPPGRRGSFRRGFPLPEAKPWETDLGTAGGNSGRYLIRLVDSKTTVMDLSEPLRVTVENCSSMFRFLPLHFHRLLRVTVVHRTEVAAALESLRDLAAADLPPDLPPYREGNDPPELSYTVQGTVADPEDADFAPPPDPANPPEQPEPQSSEGVEPPEVPRTTAVQPVVSGVAPFEVRFDASESSDPNGQPLQFLWDMGDGTTVATASGTHTYNVPGEYTIRIRVRDPDGAEAVGHASIFVFPPASEFSEVPFKLPRSKFHSVAPVIRHPSRVRIRSGTFILPAGKVRTPYAATAMELERWDVDDRRPVEAYGFVVVRKEPANPSANFAAIESVRERRTGEGSLSSDELPEVRVKSLQVSRGLDGSSGTIVWDRADPTFSLVAAPVLRAGSVRVVVEGGNDTVGGTIFTGIAMPRGLSNSDGANDVRIPLKGREVKITEEGGLRLVNMPFFDGCDHVEVVRTLCAYAGIELVNHAAPWRLPSNYSISNPVVNFATGTPVWQALQEIQRMASTVGFFDRLGQFVYADVGSFGPRNWVYEDYAIQSYDLEPDVTFLHNALVITGLVSDAPLGASASDEVLRSQSAATPTLMFVRLQADVDIPWDKMAHYAIAGVLRSQAEMNRIALRAARGVARARVTGSVTIPGNAEIELLDVFNGEYIITAVSHQADTQAKSFRTSLQVERIVPMGTPEGVALTLPLL
jgi:hypothetical protein